MANILWTSALTAVAGLAVGLLLGRRTSKVPLDEAQQAAKAAMDRTSGDEFKMVMLVRKDLEMRQGKIAAQCGHAVLGAYKQARSRHPEWLAKWERYGQAKIALKIDSEQALLEFYKKASDAGLPAYIVVDAGRTQVEPNSKTVLAIGPAPVEVINQITSELKLL